MPNKKAKQRKMEKRKSHDAIKKWKRQIKLEKKKGKEKCRTEVKKKGIDLNDTL